jgi:hypothetical protein
MFLMNARWMLMFLTRPNALFLTAVLLSLFTWPIQSLAGDSLTFEVRLSESVTNKPISGRLFVFISSRGEPRLGPNWFNPEPFFALDVTGMKPGQTIRLDDKADGFPAPLSKLKGGKYRIQALLDHDFYASSPGKGVGNFFSEVAEIEVDKATKAIPLTLTKIVPSKTFRETDSIKLITMKSSLLGQFHKREVLMDAAVVLPNSYGTDSKRRYPVFYEVSGFGGTLGSMASRAKAMQSFQKAGNFEFIHVLLTGQCKWGHHVYANSAANGPRGDALIKEMIPMIDSQFRTVAASGARYVGGHSSGGWSSIWLQLNYPETFGGLWSSSPDPVDFRDYQQTNLYAKPAKSIYFFDDEKKKPLARSRGRVIIWYPDFAKMDDVIGRGGQLRSFEAVFSPLDENGSPKRMWNRQAGTVNPDVVEAWKKYDINLFTKNNWSELAPKVKGKINILMGTEDTFYLEGATRLYSETLKELGSDAKVSLIPGDHGTVLSRNYYTRRTEEMKAVFLKKFTSNGASQ